VADDQGVGDRVLDVVPADVLGGVGGVGQDQVLAVLRLGVAALGIGLHLGDLDAVGVGERVLPRAHRGQDVGVVGDDGVDAQRHDLLQCLGAVGGVHQALQSVALDAVDVAGAEVAVVGAVVGGPGGRLGQGG